MKLIEIYNKTTEALEFINKYNTSVNYRLYNELEKKSYIGSAKNLLDRMYNKYIGHVGSIFNDKIEHDYIHKIIVRDGLNNFEIFIEESFNSFEDAENNEISLIEKYDSFYNGYNLTLNGKGGTVGTILVSKNNETIRIKKNLLFEYLEKGYSECSNRIVITDPITKTFKRILSNEVQDYLDQGWILGNEGLSTTKNFISIYNELENTSKKIDKSELQKYLDLGWKKGFPENKGRKKCIILIQDMKFLLNHQKLKNIIN